MGRDNRVEDDPKASVDIEWIPPPPDLRDLAHTFYSVDIGSGLIEEPSPAYSAQLLFIVEGYAELTYAHGGSARTSTLFLNAPQLESGRIRVTGPFRAVAASLTPLGWAALTAQPADTIHDRVLSPEAFAAPTLIRDIHAWAEQPGSGSIKLTKGVELLVAVLRGASHPIKPRHREFVETATRWLGSELNPKLEALYDSLALSPRQIQRLSRQFFGASPTQVLMRHRAIRTAMLLSNPSLPQSLFDELGTAYFDQAHMIRDIRRFTGRTPADLAVPSLAQESLDPAGHGETAAVLKIG
ncbi:MAG: helix-turn-helix domain-containing protein [Erythrobacter sp.]|nr:helix-turn-helix domain-containing protein [Erythrobacter sp.]